MDNKISCNIIKDLIALQVDDLASEDSSDLIKAHIKYCNDCEEYLSNMKTEEMPLNIQEIQGGLEPSKKSEKILIGKFKKLRNQYMILMVLLGAIVTVILTAGKFQFRAILFCPILGALVYLLFKKPFIGSIWIFILELIKQIAMSVTGILNGNYIEPLSIEDYIYFLYSGAIYALVYALLTAIGVIIGLLIEKIFFE